MFELLSDQFHLHLYYIYKDMNFFVYICSLLKENVMNYLLSFILLRYVSSVFSFFLVSFFSFSKYRCLYHSFRFTFLLCYFQYFIIRLYIYVLVLSFLLRYFFLLSSPKITHVFFGNVIITIIFLFF